MFAHLRQLFKESLVYGVAGVLSRFMSFFLVPIYTRVFTTEEYGVIGLVAATMGLLQILVVLALDNSAARWYYDTQDILDQKKSIGSWLWSQISISLIFGLAMIAMSEWLGMLITERSDAGIYFRLSGASLPLMALSGVLINWFRFQRRAVATVVFTVFTSFLTVSLIILFVVVFHHGLKGLYWAQLISTGSSSLAAAWIIRDWIRHVISIGIV